VGKARHLVDDGNDPLIDLIGFQEGIAEPTDFTIVMVITLYTQVELPVLQRHQRFVQIVLLTPLTGGEHRCIESQCHHILSWKPNC
jgi:hypothetical protein